MPDVERVYESFFDIDPSYSPVMTEDIINKEENQWKGFYPHKTFIKLLESTTNAISRHTKKSLWVTGSYGTGKSHAVLTLKRMLEAKEEDVNEYFTKHKLDDNLLQQFNALKTRDSHILTIYRSGSSDIHSDNDLANIIQSCIKKAMKEQGFDVTTTITLKDEILLNLKNKPGYAEFIDTTIQEKYKAHFSPYSNVDSVIDVLENGSEKEVQNVVQKYLQMAENEKLITVPIDTETLVKWIEEVTLKNKLIIFFIWDEFTEFFRNNPTGLSGFQNIVQASGSFPFIFCIVTHVSGGQLQVADKDKMKTIIDRFSDIINIELPDNMAFKLMGDALTVKQGEEEQWGKLKEKLWTNVKSAGTAVIRSTKDTIIEEDFKQILPFHPYAALILKHLSVLFSSNQRSLFEYIKGGQQKDKGHNFKSFIQSTGPHSNNPYLTCDVIWNYFFSGDDIKLGKDFEVLRSFYLMKADENKNLDENAKIILKTVLLLYGLSEKASHVKILRPTETNLCNAFLGSDINQSVIKESLEKLEKHNILSVFPNTKDEPSYSPFSVNQNQDGIKEIKENLRKNLKTIDILQKGDLDEKLGLTAMLKLRYDDEPVTTKNISSLSQNKNPLVGNKIPLLLTFAKDEGEKAEIHRKIQESLTNNKQPDMIIADLSSTILSESMYDELLEFLAYENDPNTKGDQKQGILLRKKINDLVNEWIDNILGGEITIYNVGAGTSQKVDRFTKLTTLLDEINQQRFPLGIEYLATSAPLFTLSRNTSNTSNSPANMGLDTSQKPRNMFNSLEKPFENIWNVPEYWKHSPSHIISQIKLDLDELIQTSFEKNGHISFVDIWNKVSEKPYGFMPCHLTAFTLGFLLKEYANSVYSWSNGSTSEDMSPNKMAESIEEIIRAIPGKLQAPKYLVQMTEDEKSFMTHSATSFGLGKDRCNNLESTRNLVATTIKNLEYPLWTLKYYLEKNSHIDNSNELLNVINGFCSFISTDNALEENERKATITNIGKSFQKHPDLSQQLKGIINQRNTLEGMRIYVSTKYPKLVGFAKELNDDNYLDAIKNKFSADSSWLWSDTDINKEIEKVCLEYEAFVLSIPVIGESVHTVQKLLEKLKSKLQSIRVPLELLVSYYPDVDEGLRYLINITKPGQSSNINMVDFVSILDNNADTFSAIFTSQKNVFAKYCENENLSKLLVNDSGLVEDLYPDIPKDQLSTKPDDFKQLILGQLQNMRCVQLSRQLKVSWLDKSKREDPTIWSKEMEFPILLLFDTQQSTARVVFNLISEGSKNETELKNAIEFLDLPIFTKLNDRTFIQQEFKKKILKRYSSVIEDKNIPSLISKLRKEVNENVYLWADSLGGVDKVVTEYAKICYQDSGYKRVYDEIDNMSANDAKEYLKELIKDNVDVGVEIIKVKISS